MSVQCLIKVQLIHSILHNARKTNVQRRIAKIAFPLKDEFNTNDF